MRDRDAEPICIKDSIMYLVVGVGYSQQHKSNVGI